MRNAARAVRAASGLIAMFAALALLAMACAGQPGTRGTQVPASAVSTPPPARTPGTRAPGGTTVPRPSNTLVPSPIAPASGTSVPQPGGTTAPAPGGTTAAPPAGGNPFGVMMPGQVANSPQGMQVARQLGAVYFRPPNAIFTNQWNGKCATCDAALKAGLQLVLTVRNGGGPLAPSYAPDDIDAYQKTLGGILDHYRPAVLAVENEENSILFYTSSPEQYATELKAACEVAHARDIQCTNGGLVSTLVALLVWDSYNASGNAQQAQDFASRAFTPGELKQLNSAVAQAQIAKGRQLLAAYRAAGIDYLNFHWYIADTGALDECVAYLRAQVSVPVISNEVGQTNDDANQTAAVMQELVALRVPIVIWFAMDAPMARGLMNNDGTLRPTGQAFQQFIAHHYGSP